MSDEINPETKTTQVVYDDFASNYQKRKRDTMINLLECGKILNDVKEALGYGVWCSFLQDTRVSESERTAHRILSVYKNFRHLLAPGYKMKADALSQLGVSHLLELQKLPDRFKKDLEIIREKDGKENTEIVKVIDEDKLGDFLEQQVEFDGKNQHVRDLPLSEMKKYIKEAQGIYTPELEDSDFEQKKLNDSEESIQELPVIDGGNDEKKQEILETRNRVDEILQNLISFNSLATALINQMYELDLGVIASISEKKATDLKKLVSSAGSVCEGVLVRCNEVKERIGK